MPSPGAFPAPQRTPHPSHAAARSHPAAQTSTHGSPGLQRASPRGGIHHPLPQTNPSSTSFRKKSSRGAEELSNLWLIIVSFLSRGCRLPAGACSRSNKLLEPGRMGCFCNRSHFLCLLLPNRHLPGSSLAFPQRSQCVGAWEAGVKPQEHPSRLTANVPSPPGHAACSDPPSSLSLHSSHSNNSQVDFLPFSFVFLFLL